MSVQPWQVKIFTLFPEIFPGFLGFGVSQKSFQQKLWTYSCVNFRDYAKDVHKTVDDVPYGGGAGMVIKPDILGEALAAQVKPKTPIYCLSPRGKVFDMAMAKKLISQPEINLVCGRYEGLDQRVIDHFQIEEISIGDVILSGGEQAALIVMDACIRLLPESLGNAATHAEESFVNGLLEYPHYTRPAEWHGMKVPAVLKSGHHEKIREWRLKQSENLTQERRPDLWRRYDAK